MTAIATGILGASGRMGSLVTELIETRYADRLHIVTSLSGASPDVEGFSACDVIIDFSLPAGTARLTQWLETVDAGPGTVISGTTGCPDELLRKLIDLGRARRVMHATNFSAGVAAMSRLLSTAGPLLESLGYVPVLTETHHRHKKDAPSGTALTLRESLRTAYPDGLQTHSIRAGEIVGRHEVTFYGDHDTLAFSHDVLDRGVFARGAIEAALWLHALSEATGYYTVNDFISARLRTAGI